MDTSRPPTRLARHETPTHLNVEDRAFYGLTVRQVMWLTVGCAGGYGLWIQWPDLAVGPRLALAALCLACAGALALVRPHGRGLEEWGFVALRYAAIPKVSVWRPREPQPAAWRRHGPDWAELAPRVRWEVDAATAAPAGAEEVPR
jgi:hypothetical protein